MNRTLHIIDVVTCSLPEYEERRAALLLKHFNGRYCYIPVTKGYLDALIELAEKSNHFLGKDCQKFVSSGRYFYMLHMRRMKVLVEVRRVRGYAVLFLAHKTERLFRIQLLTLLCKRHPDLEPMFKKGLNLPEIYDLTDNWVMYKDSEESSYLTFKEFLAKYKFTLKTSG